VSNPRCVLNELSVSRTYSDRLAIITLARTQSSDILVTKTKTKTKSF